MINFEINLFFTKAAQRFALPDQRAGVDSLWEQDSVEAWKMLENAAESRWSGARFVGQPLCLPE